MALLGMARFEMLSRSRLFHLITSAIDAVRQGIILKTAQQIPMKLLIPIRAKEFLKSTCGGEILVLMHKSS